MQSPPSITRMTRPRRTGHQAHVGGIRSAKGSGEKT